MPQEKIIIKFSAKGDKALINAIKQLDIATKRLQGKTSLYEKELKKYDPLIDQAFGDDLELIIDIKLNE